MSFKNLYAEKARDSAPLIYEKLTDLCERSDELFTGFKNTELLDGRHYVEAIIGDKYFTHVSAETIVIAKNELATKIYKHFGVNRPLKDPAANLLAQTNMLAFWNPLTVAQTFLSDRLVISFAGETDLTYKLEAKYVPPIDPKQVKRQKTEVLVGEGYGCSAASARYKIGVTVLQSEKFREDYIKWVKGGKKGCYEDSDTHDLLVEKHDVLQEWNKKEKCELDDSKVLHDLKILCEAYELEEPEYYTKIDETNNEIEYLCSVAAIAKNEKLETASMQALDHLKNICACRDRLVAEKVAKQEQDRIDLMQSKILAAAEKKRQLEEFLRMKQTEKEDKQLKHLKWLQDGADRREARFEEQRRNAVERKKKAMMYAGVLMTPELEAQLLIELECGIPESQIMKSDYVIGQIDPVLLKKREQQKIEAALASKQRHEAVLKAHADVRAANEALKEKNKSIMIQRRIEKENKRVLWEAQNNKEIKTNNGNLFEYVSEYNGQPVFTHESLSKAYADEIDNNPIVEIEKLVENMFAGYQAAELEVTELANIFSNAGTYFEAKIDTLKTVAYGKQAKEAKRTALQAMCLTIKNGGELEDGFVDQLQERGVLGGETASKIHKAHPVHQLNNAQNLFEQKVKYILDIEQPRWTIVCHFGDLTAIGHDETKALAKQRAAEEMLPLVFEKFGSLEDAMNQVKKKRNLRMAEARKAKRALEKRQQHIAENTDLGDC